MDIGSAARHMRLLLMLLMPRTWEGCAVAASACMCVGVQPEEWCLQDGVKTRDPDSGGGVAAWMASRWVNLRHQECR